MRYNVIGMNGAHSPRTLGSIVLVVASIFKLILDNVTVVYAINN